MIVSLIAAMAQKRALGLQGDMPWHLPADLQYFKKMTLAKPVIMGRKTFESINSKPLPKRLNIIISRQTDYPLTGDALLAKSLSQAIELAKQNNPEEIMIVGGAEIYRQALEQQLLDRMYLTFIDAAVDADTFFPQWDAERWYKADAEQHQADENNPYDYCFTRYEKI